MPKTIKYIGVADMWPELAVTGKPSAWRRGQQEERSDAEAWQLLATGLFAAATFPVTRDSFTGVMYAGEAVVPVAWKTVEAPSSDVTTQSPASPAWVNAAVVALSATGGGALLFPASVRPWVFDDEILMANNVSIVFSPGVTVTRPDPFTLQCQLQAGSPIVNVVNGNTGRLKSLAQVDGSKKAQYIVSAGAALPLATRVNAVTGQTTFTMDKNAAATETVALTFHYAHNIIRRNNVTNARLMAPWGRATLDGNGAASPITFDSNDSIRNCIQTAGCTDVETSGLLLQNAHYHGEIGVSNSGRIYIKNVLTYRNGFRSIHYHGDLAASQIADFWMDEVESLEDGWKGFTISQNDLNSGIFVCFDNCHRYQVGRIRARRSSGLGVHMTGAIAASVRSSQISYDSLITEDCYIGLGMFNGLRHTRIGSVQAKGRITQIANCTLGAGTQQLPRWKSDGSAYVVGAVMSPFILPVGTDMTQFYPGMVLYLQDLAGNKSVQLRIWSVDAPSRTLQVFHNDTEGVTRAWVVGQDGTGGVLATFGTMMNGVYINQVANADRQFQHVHMESVQIEGAAGKTFSMLNAGSGVVAFDGLSIGTLKQSDSMNGSYLYCVQDLCIGHFSSRSIGDLFTGNDTNSIDLLINRSNDVFIGKFFANSQGNGVNTRVNAAMLQVNNEVKNMKVMSCMAQNGNGSNFAIDWTSATNIMVGDPRNLAGVALAPTGAATNGVAFKYGLA